MPKSFLTFILLFSIFYFLFPIPIYAQSPLSISNVQSPASVTLYDKLEVSFAVSGTVATNLQWPYDPGPVTGMATASLKTGITVDGLFLPPGQTNWANAIVHPAFLFQPTIKDRTVMAGSTNSEWIYPTGDAYWVVRFAPKSTGNWQFKLRAQDNSNYPNWIESPAKSFTVGSARAGVHGFVQVSQRDKRYFEYSDGTPFTGTGINAADNGIYHSEQQAEMEFRDRYAVGKTNFARTWMDMESIFSRGTHGWDAWRTSSDTSDSLRTTEQVYKDHDFSVKLSASSNFIAQASNGNQRMAGGLEAGKTYKVRVTANLGTTAASNLAVRLLSSATNFSSTLATLGPNGTWTTTDLGNGWKLYESSFTNSQGRLLFKGSTALSVGVTSGIAYLDELYIGEDLGAGKVGPNVVFRGKMNYHQNFDQIASANWDMIYTHAETYGIALKVVITDKQDFILDRIRLSDGVFDNSIGINHDNFHSLRGYKVRRLHEYYWRYLSARWGYSRGIHSFELINEGNPGHPGHRDQTKHLAETVNALDHNHMATTSFWYSFPAGFWGDPNFAPIHYADVHAYISSGWIADSSLESDAAKYHIAYSQDTRNSLLATGNNKPIVRGEAGIDVLGNQNEQDALANDTNGVWLHNYIWAMLHPGGLYELYWWSDNVRNRPGPDGNTANGLFDIFAPYNDFMSNVPVNAGGYVDIGITQSANNRVVGQKNNNGNGSTRAHLWMQDVRHEWKTPGSGSLSANVTITGMKPNTTFPVEWWDFNTKGELRKRNENLTSNSSGNLTLNISTSSYNGSAIVDTAVKIGNYTSLPTPPPISPTPTPPDGGKPGDANGDGKVDGLDYVIWLNHYNQSATGAGNGDFNNSGKVDGLDYVIWLNNYL